MEIETRLRSRIEAILANDARNSAEMRLMAVPDEPFEADPFDEERNLYQRIINNYRNALSEVNSLLEEHVAFLSGFYRIIESIKDKHDFRDMCAQVADCALREFGAEYCGLVFLKDNGPGESILCLEGLRESREFISVHSSPKLLGSEEFETILRNMAADPSEILNVEDVYREPRFNKIDFPSAVRSLIYIPIALRNTSIGFLVLGSSRPRFFNENHVRVLRILAATVAQLRFLTARQDGLPELHLPPPEPAAAEVEDGFSVVILDFESKDAYGRAIPLDKAAISSFRRQVVKNLRGMGYVLFHDEDDLLVLFPDTLDATLQDRIGLIRATFEQWKQEQGERMRGAGMNVGYSISEGEDDLSRTLELASLIRTHDDEGIAE